MSLKRDIEKHPWAWSKELVAALEDYKNGKINSKRKLRKFAKREISEHYYNELIERYSDIHRINKEKNKRKLYLFGHTIEEWLPVLYFFINLGAIGVVIYSIQEQSFLTTASLGYLLISFFIYHYSNTEDKQEKDYKIAELKREIEGLKSTEKDNKIIIELLEKELEKARAKVDNTEE